MASAVALKALESKEALLECTVHPRRSNREESFDESKMAATPCDNQSGVRVLGKLLDWQCYSCTERGKRKQNPFATRSQWVLNQTIHMMYVSRSNVL